ncbi:MAG: hypothetical protein V4572_02530 [Bacteroidota bacterium]
MQFPHAFVVGGFGADFADSHDFVPGDADGVLETVQVPELEQGDVEADVSWVEGVVGCYEIEVGGEVFYVVHFFIIERLKDWKIERLNRLKD